MVTEIAGKTARELVDRRRIVTSQDHAGKHTDFKACLRCFIPPLHIAQGSFDSCRCNTRTRTRERKNCFLPLNNAL
jgi:hypothetical protein